MMRLRDLPDDINDISRDVLDAAIEVHRVLGNRLAERTYRDCLAHELRLRGRRVDIESAMPLTYKDLHVASAHFADIVVDDRVIVELKCLPELTAENEAQVLTYLRMSGIRLGMLFNFRSVRIKDGFRRFAHDPSRISA